mmetsp:Transcript_2560/g.6771  ORF Transcript_2560/g.6771 Transcript_2560/m.6771 type:complete len:278 (+) Transcript_2560:2624-3457(+)
MLRIEMGLSFEFSVLFSRISMTPKSYFCTLSRRPALVGSSTRATCILLPQEWIIKAAALTFLEPEVAALLLQGRRTNRSVKLSPSTEETPVGRTPITRPNSCCVSADRLKSNAAKLPASSALESRVFPLLFFSMPVSAYERSLDRTLNDSCTTALFFLLRSNGTGLNFIFNGFPGPSAAPTCRTVAMMSSNVLFSRSTPLTPNSSSPRVIIPVFSAGRMPSSRGFFLKEPAIAGRPSIGDSKRRPRPKSGCGVTKTSYSCLALDSSSSLPSSATVLS